MITKVPCAFLSRLTAPEIVKPFPLVHGIDVIHLDDSTWCCDCHIVFNKARVNRVFFKRWGQIMYLFHPAEPNKSIAKGPGTLLSQSLLTDAILHKLDDSVAEATGISTVIKRFSSRFNQLEAIRLWQTCLGMHIRRMMQSHLLEV